MKSDLPSVHLKCSKCGHEWDAKAAAGPTADGAFYWGSDRWYCPECDSPPLPVETPKSYGTINVVYRASVVVPIRLYEAIGHLPVYGAQTLAAAQLCSGVTGQNSYSEIEEWYEGPDRAECEAFVSHWDKFINEQLSLLEGAS